MLLVYINLINIYFENKHPILYMFINIICIIVIFSCIGSILLSLYSIFEESVEISYEIIAKLLHIIYKMTGHGDGSTGSTAGGGSSTGSTGNPGPSHGGAPGPFGPGASTPKGGDSSKRKRNNTSTCDIGSEEDAEGETDTGEWWDIGTSNRRSPLTMEEEDNKRKNTEKEYKRKLRKERRDNETPEQRQVRLDKENFSRRKRIKINYS